MTLEDWLYGIYFLAAELFHLGVLFTTNSLMSTCRFDISYAAHRNGHCQVGNMTCALRCGWAVDMKHGPLLSQAKIPCLSIPVSWLYIYNVGEASVYIGYKRCKLTGDWLRDISSNQQQTPLFYSSAGRRLLTASNGLSDRYSVHSLLTDTSSQFPTGSTVPSGQGFLRKHMLCICFQCFFIERTFILYTN